MSAINKENSEANQAKITKVLADCGICSRRKGEEMISNSEVTVNGDIARLGARIDPNQDIVKVNGKRIQAFRQDTLTLLVNKPKGFTCSNSDEHAGEVNLRTVGAKA